MKNRKIVFISVFTGIFMFGISMVMIGSTLPMLKERFGMNDIEAGWLFSILPIGLLVGSVSFGPIADEYGYRWVLSTAGLFLALGFLGIAHADFINLLRFCIFLFGIGGGVMNGASSALVSDLSENENKITNLNWLGAFFGVGAFCMPLALSAIDKSYYTLLIDMASASSLVAALFFAASCPLLSGSGVMHDPSALFFTLPAPPKLPGLMEMICVLSCSRKDTVTAAVPPNA